MSAQVKLLEFLENHEVRRLGATRGHRIDVRIISATHRDLESTVKQGKFRADFTTVSARSLWPCRRFASDAPRITPLAERTSSNATRSASRGPTLRLDAEAKTMLIGPLLAR